MWLAELAASRLVTVAVDARARYVITDRAATTHVASIDDVLAYLARCGGTFELR